MPRKLTPDEADQFRGALLSAFPNQGSLEQVLFYELGRQLDQVAGGRNYGEIVTNLIIWAEAHGQTEALIEGARKQNPGNFDLGTFAENYYREWSNSSDQGQKLPNQQRGESSGQTSQGNTTPIRILFLAANPQDTGRLRLDEEMRTIGERLQMARYRDRIKLEMRPALRVTDLAQYLLDYDPQIVHFSGHGSSTGEIILEDGMGQSKPVSSEALAGTFRTLKDNIRCVVLNACFSEVQARAIVQQIDCVVGMSRAISDSDAISFAGGFYRGIGFGRSLQTAFELGLNEIDLQHLSREAIPQLRTKAGIDASKVVLITTP